MKKIINTLANQVFLTLLVLIFCLSVNAQKLPNIQASSLRAPLSIKTDGKLTEWDNKLQAYNHSTNIFYTIANDDDKLYLTIQAKDALIARKIIAGAITFALTGKKNDNESLSVTFPFLNDATKSTIGRLISEPVTAKDSAGKMKQADSLMYLMNNTLTSKAKEIKVTGTKAIEDTMISVYNNFGIKAIARFDNKKALTYELAIPIKYFEPYIINKPSKFFYHISLNGLLAATVVHQTNNGPVMVGSVPRGLGGASNYDLMVNPTDFWGEYTLAK